MKKIVCYMMFVISILFVSSKVSAIEDSKLIKDMVDDNVIQTKMEKPETAQDLDAIIFAYVYKLMREDNYINNTDYLVKLDNIDYGENKYEIDDVEVVITDLDTSKEYRAKLSYIKVEESIKKKVNKIISEINEKKEYVVEDLSMVNYYYNVNKKLDGPDHINYVASFSHELKKVAGNSNITFSYDARMGVGYPVVPVGRGYFVISYNDIAYGSLDLSLKAKNIIYVPDETKDTPEEYVKAAQKRIDDYLGENKAKITYSGKITDSEYSAFYDMLTSENSNKDELYYLIVGNNKFEFLVVKDSSKMINPKYKTSDIDSQIDVSSDNKNIPLDTNIKVEKKDKDNKEYKYIEEKIDSEIYNVVDIKLYSDTIKDYITKLDDGSFDVEIPITEEMKNKKLVVYYINDKGEKEKHDVVIKDDKASFTTNHFSIYTLAEELEDEIKDIDKEEPKEEPNSSEGEKIENPNTYDGIVSSLFIAIISIISLIATIVYLKKEIK